MNTFERESEDIKNNTIDLEPIADCCGIIICNETWDKAKMSESVELSISVRKFMTFIRMYGEDPSTASFGNTDYDKLRIGMYAELYIWHKLAYDPYLAGKLGNKSILGYLTASCYLEMSHYYPKEFIKSVVNIYAPLLYKLSAVSDKARKRA